MEERIILYSLNQILSLIDELNATDDIKKSLKVMVLYDFLDNEQYNDEYCAIPYFEFIKNIQSRPLHATLGIIYISQLERFLKVFITRMRTLCFPNFELLLDRFNNLQIQNNPPLDYSVLNVSDNHGYEEIIRGADCVYNNYALDIFLFYQRFDKIDGSNILDSLNLSLPIFNDIYFRDIGKIYSKPITANLTIFISSWFTQKASLASWCQFPYLSIFSFLSNLNIHINLKNKIFNHMKVLSDIYVDQIFNTLVREFLESNSVVDDINKAEAYLNLIELLVNNKPTTSFGSGINSVFNATSSVQLNNILLGHIPSLECYDIHSKKSYANSFAILKFRTYLENFIKKNKAESFDKHTNNQNHSSPESNFSSSHNSINFIINDLFKDLENLEYFEDKNTFEIWHSYKYGNIYNTEEEIEEGNLYDDEDKFFIFDKKNNRFYYDIDEFDSELELKIDDYIKNTFRPLFLDCKESTKLNIAKELESLKSDLIIEQNELKKQLITTPSVSDIKKIKLPIIKVKLNYIQKLSDYTNLRLDKTSTTVVLKPSNTPPLNLDNSVKNTETPKTSATPSYEVVNKEQVSDDEVSEYLNDWIQCRVTLDQWLNFPDIDINSHLKEFELSSDEVDSVREHKHLLYRELTNRVFENKFYSIFKEGLQSNEKKLTIAKLDLALIEDLISGNIDEIKEERLKSTLGVLDWKKTTLQFDFIMRDKYSCDDNFNIHSKDCYLVADTIFIYKKYLDVFIRNTNSEILNKESIITNDSTPHRIVPKSIDSNDNFKSFADHKNLGDNKKNKNSYLNPTINSYKYIKYTNNYSAITDLCNSLKGKFIKSDTDLINFRKIFNDSTPDTPIVWIGGISALHYFIKKLHELELVDNVTNSKKWSIGSTLFIDSKGDKFESHKLRVSKIPANTDLLDKAINHLK